MLCLRLPPSHTLAVPGDVVDYQAAHCDGRLEIHNGYFPNAACRQATVLTNQNPGSPCAGEPAATECWRTILELNHPKRIRLHFPLLSTRASVCCLVFFLPQRRCMEEVLGARVEKGAAKGVAFVFRDFAPEGPGAWGCSLHQTIPKLAT